MTNDIEKRSFDSAQRRNIDHAFKRDGQERQPMQKPEPPVTPKKEYGRDQG